MNLPTLRLHKASGQYRAAFNRKYEYFGKDWEKAQAAFKVRLAEWLLTEATGRGQTTVADVATNALDWAQTRYRPSGRWRGEAKVLKFALRFLNCEVTVKLPERPRGQTVYLPSLPARQMTVIHLAAVQQRMIDLGKRRNYINGCIRRIVGAFERARIMGLIPAEVVADLKTLPPVPVGHHAVKDNPPVLPVSDAHFRAILPHLSDTMLAIVWTLRLTGYRVGEIMPMQVRGFTEDDGLLIYDLGTNHKTGTTHRRLKKLYFGKDSQKWLRPYYDAAMATKDTEAFVFPSDLNPTGYVQEDSVRKAIQKACELASIPPFTTHQLRHSKATEIVEREALKVVKAKLGQSSESAARVYAELDAIAREQARLSG